MALLSCPECGKDNVSSAAHSCPNCGFPLKEHFSSLEEKNVPQGTIYCDVLTGKDESFFSNGLENGVVGKCKERMGEYDYRVENNILYVTRNAGTATYIIVGDYLLNTKGECKGTIEDGEIINTSCTIQNFMGGEDVNTFFFDGSMVEIRSGKTSKGTYKRKGDIVAISNASTGYQYYCYLIYNKTLYKYGHIKKERASDIENLINSSKISSNHISDNHSNLQQSQSMSMGGTSNINWGKILGIVAAIIVAILLLKACSGSSYDTNDDKCDVCGKRAYTKLSDGNEYCYEHYKNAIDYYLND